MLEHVWNAVLDVVSTGGTIVYSANVSTNSASAPSGKLTSGTAYLWTVSASISVSSSSAASIVSFTVLGNKFTVVENVMVSGTGEIGLILHSCANTAPTCPALVTMPEGTAWPIASTGSWRVWSSSGVK